MPGSQKNARRKRRESGAVVWDAGSDGRLESTQSKLSVLYAKQGRAQQFTTQAARDKYLRDEIASLQAYETTQQERVNDLASELGNAKQYLNEVLSRNEEQSQKSEERRDRLRNMSEEVTTLKEKVDGMQEQRKYVNARPERCLLMTGNCGAKMQSWGRAWRAQRSSCRPMSGLCKA